MAIRKEKNEILAITGPISFEDIESALNFLDINNVKVSRAKTLYMMKNGKKINYSLNQIIKTINNDIKNNVQKLTTLDVESWEVAGIFESTNVPKEYKIVTPWNENGKKEIEIYRQNLLDYSKSLGYQINDEPDQYTAIRYKNQNFAEIHNPDKDSKIRIDVFFDRLPENIRNTLKLERYPDNFKYSLNGKFMLTLDEKTYEQISNLIEYMYKNGDEIKFKKNIKLDSSPNFSVDEWLHILQDTEITNENNLRFLLSIKDFGGSATCTQLSHKYGFSMNYYSNNLSSYGQRISKKYNIGLNPDYWTILFTGYSAPKEIDGCFVWELKPELNEALNKIECSNISLYKETDDEKDDEIPQQPKNQILYGPPGTGKTYKINQIIENVIYPQLEIPSINEESNLFSLLDDESFINMKWWIKIATAFYIHNKKKHYLTHKEIVNLKFLQQWYKKSDDYKNLETFSRSVSSELQKCSNRVGTEQQYKRHKFDYFEEKDNKYKLTNEGESELKQQLKNVGIEIDNQIEQNISTQKTKKELSKEYYTFCTFHQSYSYEEFVEGIKPHLPQNTPESNENNNKLTYQHNCGVFKSICIKARKEPDKKFIIFIDEINRGNISKIFGELITLIEEDKRENINNSCGMYNTIEVTLPYTHEKFSVPNNLYIIGTMNTSDRSIASVDIALRRRFKFKEMMPQTDLVADFSCNFKGIFELLNKRISVLLDRDHQIGHSYFIKDKYENAGVKELKDIWFDSILPLLNEYFYGDWEKLQKLLGCAKEKDDDTAFIKKLDIVKFADETTLDDEQNCFDFTDKEGIDFEAAMKHAFKDVFKIEEKNG